MHSSQYPDHPARRSTGHAPRTGALTDLIAQARRLRDDVEAVRRGEPEDAPGQRVRRAVWNLAVNQLTDFTDQLRALDGAAGPPAVPQQGGARVELGGRIGSAEWSLLTDGVVWSEELFFIFGRSLEEGPLTLDELPSYLVEEDRPLLTAAVTRCLVDGRSAECEIRIVRPDGRLRTLQLAGEPILDDLGSTVAMWAMIRDVSELRADPGDPGGTPADGTAAPGAGDAGPDAASGRRRARSEHRLSIALQESALVPWLSPPDRPARPGVPRSLELAGCYVPAASGVPLEGKWHDWLDLPDGSSLLSVGDLSGRGPTAAAGTATTLGALRGIALTGSSPARWLECLNELLDCASQPVLASLVCCRYRPEDGSLLWAQAGHPAPLLCRDGGGRMLARPAGTLLGAVPGAVYEERTETLESGDTLVLHTDGLLPPAREGGDGRGADPRLLRLAPRLAMAPSARDVLRLVLRECVEAPGADRGAGDDADRPEDACLLVARVS